MDKVNEQFAGRMRGPRVKIRILGLRCLSVRDGEFANILQIRVQAGEIPSAIDDHTRNLMSLHPVLDYSCTHV